MDMQAKIGTTDVGVISPAVSGQPFDDVNATISDLFGSEESVELTLTVDSTAIGNLPKAYKDTSSGTTRLNADAFDNLMLVLHYTLG
jgi:hypothetical protein